MFEKEELKELLKNHTVAEISIIKGCGEITVYRYIKKYNLKKEKPLYQNREWLIKKLKFKTIQDIAIEANCNNITISRWMKKFKISKEKPLYQNKEWLMEQTKKFKNAKAVADHYGMIEDTINSWYRRYNIKFNADKTSDFVEDYFENIDTEHKAYWLGLLTADGFMHKSLKNFGIGLKTKDKYILQKFLDDIKYKTNIATKISGFNKRSNYITICSTRMCKDLIYHGIVPHKSGKEYIDIENINERYIKDFIRGYIDGDGWISICKKTKNPTVGICSMSINILYDIKEYLENNLNVNCHIRRRKNKKKLFDITINSSNAIKLLDYIYKDSTIHLIRKFNRYENVKNLPLYNKCKEKSS